MKRSTEAVFVDRRALFETLRVRTRATCVRFARALAIGAAATLLAACVSVDRYPEDWTPPPANPPATCSFPQGFFANHMDDRPQSASLSSYFDLGGAAEYVRFTTDDHGVPSVAAIRYGEAIGERRLDAEDHRPECERGWLVFDVSAGWVSSPAGFGVESRSFALMQVGDYLLLRSSGSFTGMAYILPAAGYGRSWHRYRSVGELDLERLKRQALERNKRSFPR